jgi:uncharacterized membrane protein HdeD (DUF308 family)
MTIMETAKPGVMLHALARNWWVILLRGICALIFGLLTFIRPDVTLATLILLWGAFALVDGIFALWAAVAGHYPKARWWLVIAGLVGIGAGLTTLIMPGVTALVLLYFIAGWAIGVGVMQIIGAIRLRKEIDNEWMLIASGALLVLFGLVLFFQRGAGALGLIFVIGGFSLVYGVTLIALALKLRSHSHG